MKRQELLVRACRCTFTRSTVCKVLLRLGTLTNVRQWPTLTTGSSGERIQTSDFPSRSLPCTISILMPTHSPTEIHLQSFRSHLLPCSTSTISPLAPFCISLTLKGNRAGISIDSKGSAHYSFLEQSFPSWGEECHNGSIAIPMGFGLILICEISVWTWCVIRADIVSRVSIYSSFFLQNVIRTLAFNTHSVEIC